MKNLFSKSLLVIALATGFTACSEDEKSTPEPTPTIVGRWEGVKEKTRVTLGSQVLQNDSVVYAAGEKYIDIRSNSLVILEDAGVKDTGTYVYVNGSLSVTTVDPVDGPTTFVFNKVAFTTSSLTLTAVDTTDTGGGNLISNYTITLKK